MDVSSIKSTIVAIKKKHLKEILKSQDEARQNFVEISAFKNLKNEDVDIILTFDPSDLIDEEIF